MGAGLEAGRIQPAQDPLATLHRINHRIDFQEAGHVERLALLVGLGHQLVEQPLLALGGGLRRQLLGKAQPHRPFQAHGTKLGTGPGSGEQGRMKTAGGHGLGPKAVALAQHQGKKRNSQAGGGNEHARHMAHRGLLFRLRPDHEAGGIAQGNHRQPERFAQLHETGSLVATHGINRAAQTGRIIGNQTERFAFDAHQRRDHSRRKCLAQLQHGTRIGQGLNQGADVVHAGAFFRNAVA